METTSEASDESQSNGNARQRWSRRYARRLLITDLIIVIASIGLSQILWFGLDNPRVAVDSERLVLLRYFVVSALLIIGWLIVLAVYGTRDPRSVGIGTTEYKGIFDATVRLFGIVAIISLLLQLELARGYIITAFPLGVLLLIMSRWLWRRWLVKQRQDGGFTSSALLVGTVDSLTYMTDQLARYPLAGYRAVGVCLAGANKDDLPATVVGIPVVGTVSDVASAAVRLKADTVILTSSDHLPPAVVRRIGWSLENAHVDVVVAPALTDIAGPRIHTRPLAGLPLLHIEVPRYEGSKRVSKIVFDTASSVLLLLVLWPVFIAIGIAIKVGSPGRVFYLQERVGLNGTVFRMIKFRTMVADAESQLGDLAELNEGQGLLFKLKDDPRVTRVGRVLRRTSLDELPQLFNVVKGDMSIVGPRPPLPSEVEKYEPHVRRRLLVKPGITGPWQIYGRSDLSWDEGVRLDLYYVENWSLTGDLVLLWRTLAVVVQGRGAY